MRKLVLLPALSLCVISLFHEALTRAETPPIVQDAPAVAQTILSAPKPPLSQSPGCELLQAAETRAMMSGAFELKLMRLCELPQERGEISLEPPMGILGPITPTGGEEELATDLLINDPATDVSGSTQSETTVASVGDTVCAAWNDSSDFSAGLSGFGYSSDNGVSWTDGGPIQAGPSDRSQGDPSLAYSLRDNAIYFASISDVGLSLWKSTNGCRTFAYVHSISNGACDDKEMMIVDNTPSSPHYGRIYVGWTDFCRSTDRNVVSYSDNGGLTWSAHKILPGSGIAGQGMWPAVAANGDVYFALLNRSSTIGGFQDQWIYKSVNGGDTWTKKTDIGTHQLRPENVTASQNCGRQALKGDIRVLSSPQIAIQPSVGAPAGYIVHAVYSYDSDGAGADNSNVFYRRSSDGAQTWSAELKLNDDQTATDQWFPALAASTTGVVAVSWYDRRLDTTSNLSFDRYAVVSSDAGLTWSANARISDVSSAVSVNRPHFDGLATCYHGDYDQIAVTGVRAHLVWSDDRRVTSSGPNPDVYYDRLLLCTTPETPTDVTATVVGDATVSIDWQPVSGAASYNVYRGQGNCAASSYTLIATGVAGTSFTDEDAPRGYSISYVVASVDSTGECESARSACAPVVVQFCGNGYTEGTEQCDGSVSVWFNCADANCTVGTPACSSECTIDYSTCGCCSYEIRPVSDSGPTPPATVAFTSPGLAYDGDDSTRALASVGGPTGLVLGHQFLFAPGFQAGQPRAYISMGNNNPQARGSTVAFYSTDDGQSWTQFGMVRMLSAERIGPDLGEVDMSHFRLKIAGNGGTLGGVTYGGISGAYDVSLHVSSTLGCGCSTDDECQNDLFCDGAETCLDGVCQAGGPPCSPGATCLEASNTCEVLPWCASSSCGGSSCAQSQYGNECATMNTGSQRCAQIDQVQECPAGQTVWIRTCACHALQPGAFCASNTQSWFCQ